MDRLFSTWIYSNLHNKGTDMKINPILSSGVKCDNPECDWEVRCSILKVFSYHNKPCPSCGYSPLMSNRHIIQWFFFVIFMFVAMIPLNLISRLIYHDKPKIIRVSTKDGGESYQFTEIKEDK